jgi:hypothetical protein
MGSSDLRPFPADAEVIHSTQFRSLWMIASCAVLVPFVIWGYYDNRAGGVGKAAFLVILSALVATLACCSCYVGARAILVAHRPSTRKSIGFYVAISGLPALWVTIFMLTLHLIGPLVIVANGAEARLVEEAWRQMSHLSAVPATLLRPFSDAAGMNNADRSPETERFVQDTSPLLDQTAAHQENRPPRQLAERAAIWAIHRLWSDGPILPEQRNRPDVVRRIGLLSTINTTLSNASSPLEGDPFVLTLLHMRFMTAVTAHALATGLDPRLEKGACDVADLMLKDVVDELKLSEHRDSVLRFDLIGATDGMAHRFKNTCAEYNTMLAQHPRTVLWPAKTLDLRLNIGRLRDYALACNDIFARDPKSKEPREMAIVHGQSLVDASLAFVHDFHQTETPADQEIALSWLDTVLMMYCELEPKFDHAPPWDVKRLHTMIIEQTTQSQKVFKRLEDKNHVTADYVVPSLLVHEKATHWMDPQKDPRGFASVVQHGLKCTDILLTGNMLETPSHKWKLSASDKAEIEKMHEYFTKLNRQVADVVDKNSRQ